MRGNVWFVETEEMPLLAGFALGGPERGEEGVDVGYFFRCAHHGDVFELLWAAIGFPEFPIGQPAQLAVIDRSLIE